MGIVLNPFTGQLDITGGASSVAPRYYATFLVADWTGPSGGFYSIAISGVTQGRGVNPQIQIYEKSGTDYILVDIDQVIVDNATGNITLKVPSSPDLRFDGKIVFI